MKVTLIRPNIMEGRSADVMQPLAIAALAAHTPKDLCLEFFDECVEEIPRDLRTDLVAMSVHTFAARRAYRMADRFREQGIPVILGGYHPTFLPEEALEHADAVVTGHAEEVWPALLRNAAAGRLGRRYGSDRTPNPEDLRYDLRLFRGKKYNPMQPVEFTRGCRYQCEFCSVSAFNRHTHITRPLEAVLEDIRGSRAKRILFVDDNIFSDRGQALRLFEALIPLKIKWGCQASLDVARDPETLKLMARSGCVVLMIGFESLCPENLRQMRKGDHRSETRYAEALARIRDRGIMVYASFVFGYDYDRPDIFDRTLGFATRHRFLIANFNTLNPMPGTALYERLRAEGRLLQERWWLDERYPYGEVMFRPQGLTPEQLKEGCIRLRLRFSGARSIARRALDFKANARNPGNLGLFLLANWITRREYQAKMKLLR